MLRIDGNARREREAVEALAVPVDRELAQPGSERGECLVRAGAVGIGKRDAELLAAKLNPGGSVTHTFKLGNGWLQIARGSVTVDGKLLDKGDGLQIEGESAITISSETGAEFLLFDLV